MMVIQEFPSPATLHVGLDVAKRTFQVDLAGRDLALPNPPPTRRCEKPACSRKDFSNRIDGQQSQSLGKKSNPA